MGIDFLSGIAPMTGRPTELFGAFVSKFLKREKHPKFECRTENTIYARNVISSNDEYSQFIILTKIGVHDYGEDILKTLHCGLRLECKNPSYPKAEIVKIQPTDGIKQVGTVTVTENKLVDMGGGINAEIKSGRDLKVLKWDISGELNFKKRNDSEKIATYSYPKQFLITRSSGVGNDASWDFKQGEAFGWKGQYDFNIIFNIPKSPSEIQSDNPVFYTIFDIYINNKKINFDPNGPVENSSPLHFIF